MTLDHPALWGIDASLEELRGKIGHLVKCAIQNSKVAWSNFSAKRCRPIDAAVLGVDRRARCTGEQERPHARRCGQVEAEAAHVDEGGRQQDPADAYAADQQSHHKAATS